LALCGVNASCAVSALAGHRIMAARRMIWLVSERVVVDAIGDARAVATAPVDLVQNRIVFATTKQEIAERVGRMRPLILRRHLMEGVPLRCPHSAVAVAAIHRPPENGAPRIEREAGPDVYHPVERSADAFEP
jgi:hypothetical protein